MKEKLIRATELSEFVYCSKAWELKYQDGAEVSPEARELQSAANAWHIERGRSLPREDSYRLGAFAALLLGAILIVFCPTLGYARACELGKSVLASGKTLREVASENGYFSLDEVDSALDPTNLIGTQT